MADELLDSVNEDDEVIGEVWRSEAHKSSSIIHREIAVSVFNSKGEVLIQQRSLTKKNDPGAWKITAAGHIESGEEPKKAAEREVFEELGLKIDAVFQKKTFLKREGMPGSIEARFFYVYYAVVGDNQKVKINKSEVNNTKWIKPKDLVIFAKDNDWDVKGLSHSTILEAEKLVLNQT